MKGPWLRRTAGLCAGAASVALVVAAANPDAIPICARAKAWVTANRANLPSTLREISRYPIAYRKAIFVAQTRDIREALWKEQFDHFLLPASPLTESQRNVVRDVRSRVSFYVGGEEGKAAAKQLKPRILAAFGQELGTAVFARLGPPDSASSIVLQEPPRVFQASMVPFVSAAMFRTAYVRLRHLGAGKLHPECSCSTSDPWCGYLDCHYGGNGTCDTSSSGCGIMLLYGCDGTCY
jgi:hypothetical protein